MYRNCNVSRNYYGSVKEFLRRFSGRVRGVSKKIIRFVKEVKINVVNVNEIVVEELSRYFIESIKKVYKMYICCIK